MTALFVVPRLVMQIITTARLQIRKKLFSQPLIFYFFTNFRTKTRTIEVYEDIPRLPPLDVLINLQQQMDIFHETRPVLSVHPAIFWTGLGQGKVLNFDIFHPYSVIK